MLEKDKWKEESSFCEQKEAKKLHPFGPRGHWPSRAGSPDQTTPSPKSFFASFFSKKEDPFFPSFTLLAPA
jgi:hypothetical protein